MATNRMTQLPEGFELDTPTLPEGFELDRPEAEPLADIEARQVESLKSYPSLYDAPSPAFQPEPDIGLAVEPFIGSGIPEHQLVGMAAATAAGMGAYSQTKDFAEVYRGKVDRRRYQGFWDEIGVNWERTRREWGSAFLGTFAKLGEMAQDIPSPYRGATMSAGVNFEVEKEAAASLWDEAQGFKYQPGEGGGVPGFIAQTLSSIVPYVGLTLGAGLVAGPVGAFGTTVVIEGNQGYREALADGQSEEAAMVNGTLRGTAVGLLETLQLSKLVKFGRGAKAAVQKEFAKEVADSAAKKIAKSAVVIGKKQLATATEEAFIEVLQEWAGDGTAFLVYGKTPEDLANRTAMAAAGGFIGALMLGPAFMVINGTENRSLKAASKRGSQTSPETDVVPEPVPALTMDEYAEKMRAGEDPLPPMVMSEYEYAEYERLEAERIQQIAEQEAEQAAGPDESGPDVRAAVAEETPAAETVSDAAGVAEEVKQPWEMTRLEYINSRAAFTTPEGDRVDLPVTYIRAGDLPTDASGKVVPSEGFGGTVKEKGVSVYAAWYDERTRKYVLLSGNEQFETTQAAVSNRPFYVAEGTGMADVGEDGETLLDASTAKVVRRVSADDLVSENVPYITFAERELSDQETPKWDKDTPGAITQDHMDLVKQAVADGKPVSGRVLEKYKSEPWAQEALAKLGPTGQPSAQGQGAAVTPEPSSTGAAPALPGDEFGMYKGRPVRIVGKDEKGRTIVRIPSGRRIAVDLSEVQRATKEDYEYGTKLEAQRRSEIAKANKQIRNDPLYKTIAEGETGSLGEGAAIGRFFVEPRYRGDVESYLGQRGQPGANNKAWSRISFKEGKRWDEAVGEFGWGEDFDDFMRNLVILAETGKEGAVSESALEKALDKGDAFLQAVANKRALLQGTDEFDVDETNAELRRLVDAIVADYGLTQQDADGIFEDLRIEKKHAKPATKTGSGRTASQVQGATRADTGVFGQPVFRPATGKQQGLLPEAGDQWIGREPERPLLDALEAAPTPTPAPTEIAPPAASGEAVEGSGTAVTPEGGDTGEPRLSSARQEWLNQHRRRLGLDGINSKTRRSWAQALAKAWEQNVPENALRIAAEITASPRALSDVETAGLVVRSVELENEHASIMAKIGPEKDAAVVASLSARSATIESEYDAISRALFASGSEKGRALASQKLTINENFSLVAVKARAKAAKGAELSVKESAKIEELTRKLSEQSEKVEALEKEMRKLQADAMLKRLRGAQKLAAMSAEQKAAKRAEAIEKVKALMKAGC